MLTELATRLRAQWPDLEMLTAEMMEIASIGDLVTAVETRLAGRPGSLPMRPADTGRGAPDTGRGARPGDGPTGPGDGPARSRPRRRPGREDRRTRRPP